MNKNGILLMILLCYCCKTYAQTEDFVTVSFKDLPLEIILDSIELKSSINFSYNSDIIPPGNLFTYSAKNISVESLLKILFVGTSLDYVRLEDQIVIKMMSRDDSKEDKKTKISIKGWVRDEMSKLPLRGANVYINGSTIGTVTDDNGNYRLNNIEPGNYMIVFTYLGYKHSMINLKGDIGKDFTVNALMTEAIAELEGVEVVAERIKEKAERSRHYRDFEKELLGSSANARSCQIENPEVLDFSYNDNWDYLDVDAADPVVIFNKALGYRIFLDLFYFNKDQGDVRFHGTARFESLEPDSNKEKKRWKRNRAKAYHGSSMHFFRALAHDRLQEEGFEITLVEEVASGAQKTWQAISRSDILSQSDDGREWHIRFDHYLHVEYLRELESAQFLDQAQKNKTDYQTQIFNYGERLTPIPSTQKSMLEMKSDMAILSKDGKIKDPLSIVIYGYWSYERIGDLVPINYSVKKEKL